MTDLAEFIPVIPSLQNTFELSEEIAKIKKELKEKESLLADWIALNRESGCLVEGNYELKESMKTKRILNVQQFAQEFPTEFSALAEIPLTKADALVGKKKVTDMCTIETSSTWKVQVRKGAVADEIRNQLRRIHA